MTSYLIITNYRCSSTTFSMEKAEELNLPWKGEILLKKQGITEIGNASCGASESEKLKEIQKGAPACFKIMPNQSTLGLETWIKSVDKHVYLYRRDFQAQARSWISIHETLDWGNNGFKNDKHRGEHGATVMHHIDPHPSKIQRLTNQLIKNWEIIREIYKKFPGEVYCLEDRPQAPYNKKYIWASEPDIPDYDIESIFRD